MPQPQNRSKFFLPAILLFLLVGIYFSYILTEMHAAGAGASQTEKNWLAQSMCGGQDSSFSCAKVNSSSLATLLGIPMALWGFSFFAFAILLTINVMLSRDKLQEKLASLLFWVLVIGSLFDLVLLIYSVAFVHSLCPLCMVTYIALWGSLAIFYFHEKKQPTWANLKNIQNTLNRLLVKPDGNITRVASFSRVFGSLFISALLGFGILTTLKSDKVTAKDQKTENIITKILMDYQAQERHTLKLPDLHPWYGEKNAPIEIIEFSDFMCPFCAKVAPVLKQIVNNSNGKMRLKFANFPLDNSCNKGMSRQLHPGACLLAKAVSCAAHQKLFWQMHDAIFNHEIHQIDIQGVLKIASQVPGLQIEQLKSCINSPGAETHLQKEMKEADRMRLEGTPSIFINGKHYKAMPHPVLFQKIMEIELDKK